MDWHNFIREVCVEHFVNNPIVIGGPGICAHCMYYVQCMLYMYCKCVVHACVVCVRMCVLCVLCE